MAKTGQSAHPLIKAIWLARVINQQSGGAVIAPWEVQDVPDEWLDVFKGLEQDLPEMQKVEQKKQSMFEAMRKNHPSYRKYLQN